MNSAGCVSGFCLECLRNNALLKTEFNPNVPHAKDFETMINDALLNTPPGNRQPLSVAEAEALKDILHCMINFSDDLTVWVYQFHFQSIPEPALRVSLPL